MVQIEPVLLNELHQNIIKNMVILSSQIIGTENTEGRLEGL